MDTVAQIQAQLYSAGTGNVANIIQSMRVDATYDTHYVVCQVEPYAGRASWCVTTSVNSAAQQTTEITNKLK